MTEPLRARVAVVAAVAEEPQASAVKKPRK